MEINFRGHLYLAMIFHRPSANRTEGLGQVDIGREQVRVLLLTFLLQLPCSKHHVGGPVLFPESTLALWKESLVKVRCETVKQDPGKYLACNGEQGYTSVVVEDLMMT